MCAEGPARVPSFQAGNLPTRDHPPAPCPHLTLPGRACPRGCCSNSVVLFFFLSFWKLFSCRKEDKGQRRVVCGNSQHTTGRPPPGFPVFRSERPGPGAPSWRWEGCPEARTSLGLPAPIVRRRSVRAGAGVLPPFPLGGTRACPWVPSAATPSGALSREGSPFFCPRVPGPPAPPLIRALCVGRGPGSRPQKPS